MRQEEHEVIIVGGGMAGLACAAELAAAGVDFLLLEGSDDVGGRVRSDLVHGFILDRGFQVLLTSYPEASRLLDYGALDLRAFHPGALVRLKGRFSKLGDPWRRPGDFFRSLTAPVGTLKDKLILARLRARLVSEDLERIWTRPARSTWSALEAEGFSHRIIRNFFQPFLGGVFLEPELETSSRMFEFVFRMFSTGLATLPAAGMGAIAKQLAERLPPDTLRLDSRVEELDGRKVRLADGRYLEARRAVVLAVDELAAARLVPDLRSGAWRSSTCLYFAAAAAPLDEPLLVLNGDEDGPINNLAVLSSVAPSYAPPGSALISVTLLGDPNAIGSEILSSVGRQLKEWFGGAARNWELLRVYRIVKATPAMPLAGNGAGRQDPRVAPGLYLCGDYRASASLQGALSSGVKAARAVIADS